MSEDGQLDLEKLGVGTEEDSQDEQELKSRDEEKKGLLEDLADLEEYKELNVRTLLLIVIAVLICIIIWVSILAGRKH